MNGYENCCEDCIPKNKYFILRIFYKLDESFNVFFRTEPSILGFTASLSSKNIEVQKYRSKNIEAKLRYFYFLNFDISF